MILRSLLNDESDLMNQMDDTILQDAIGRIFARQTNYVRIDKGDIYCDVGLHDTPSFSRNPANCPIVVNEEMLKRIFGGEHLTEYKYFKHLRLTRPNFSKNGFKQPITIDNIDYLYILTSAFSLIENSNDLNIHNIKDMEVVISYSNTYDWMQIIRNTNIQRMSIIPADRGTSAAMRHDGLNLRGIGLNVDTLILHPNFIPGADIEDMDYDKVKQYISDVKKSNNIKNIYMYTYELKDKMRLGGHIISVDKLTKIQ